MKKDEKKKKIYKTLINLCPQPESNRRPTAYKAVALTRLSYAGVLISYNPCDPNVT